LCFLLHRLLESLFARLMTRTLALLELRLKLVLEDQEIDLPVPPRLRGEKDLCRTLRLPVPTQDAKTLLKLLQLDLQAHPPQAPWKKIWMKAERANPRNAQSGLFLPATPPPERVELLLARVGGVVGEGNAGVVEVLDTHRPDSFRVNKIQTQETRKRVSAA